MVADGLAGPWYFNHNFSTSMNEYQETNISHGLSNNYTTGLDWNALIFKWLISKWVLYLNFFIFLVVIVSHAKEPIGPQQGRHYSPVFERRRHNVDSYNVDHDDDDDDGHFGWSFDQQNLERRLHTGDRAREKERVDLLPRRDLTQCLQESLIASTTNLAGIQRQKTTLTSFQRFRRRFNRFCTDFGMCWRGMSTWLAKKFPSRSKRIDVMARILFPLVFAIFNLSYWTFYLLQHESSKFN